MAGTRGWAVSWNAQRAPPDRGSRPTGARRRGYRGGAAAGVRLRQRSGLRTPPGRARWGRRVRRHWSGTWPRCAAPARCRARGHGTSRRSCGARCGGATRVVAATSTRTAGGAAAPAIGWRSTTSCRLRSAAVRSRRISECAAVPTTGCGTPGDMLMPRVGRPEARRAPVFAVDPRERGRAAGSHGETLSGPGCACAVAAPRAPASRTRYGDTYREVEN